MKIVCGNCGAKYIVPESMKSKKVRCLTCKNVWKCITSDETDIDDELSKNLYNGIDSPQSKKIDDIIEENENAYVDNAQITGIDNLSMSNLGNYSSEDQPVYTDEDIEANINKEEINKEEAPIDYKENKEDLPDESETIITQEEKPQVKSNLSEVKIDTKSEKIEILGIKSKKDLENDNINGISEEKRNALNDNLLRKGYFIAVCGCLLFAASAMFQDILPSYVSSFYKKIDLYSKAGIAWEFVKVQSRRTPGNGKIEIAYHYSLVNNSRYSRYVPNIYAVFYDEKGQAVFRKRVWKDNKLLQSKQRHYAEGIFSDLPKEVRKIKFVVE